MENRILEKKIVHVVKKTGEDKEFFEALIKVETPEALKKLLDVTEINVTGQEAREGFQLLRDHLEEQENRPLSDDELDYVAGGAPVITVPDT